MKYTATLLTLICSLSLYAKVELPQLFADNMVLQRDQDIPVWGWADKNESIVIQFKNQKVKTTADKNGKWKLTLKPEAAGGPFEMRIEGKNSITIKNILIGEVWVCSGQSNMEFQVSGVMNAKQEMMDAENPMIRQFLIEKDMDLLPKEKFKKGQWSVCNEDTVADFTAVGYFFAKKLYEELQVPIGLINSTWGGTCVETWTSREAFESSPDFKDMIAKLPSVDIQELMNDKVKAISDALVNVQGSAITTENEERYIDLNFDDSKWPEIEVPSLWETTLGDFDGVVWYRKTFEISKDDAQEAALLELAKVDDRDVTYINGVEVGTTNLYSADRSYKIPSKVLKEGKNVIAVRVFDYTGGGGIYGDSNLKLSTKNSSIDLKGKWKFKVVELNTSISPNVYPTLLYNAMIAPMIPYAIQGVLWYQGEANVRRAYEYRKSFPLMIKDWRQQWQQGDFPFYFVQLSSFDEFKGNSNTGSPWAELREAQTYTLNHVENTGMAVTTDIGNAKDIHPINKQDVGKRLAAIALNNTYAKKRVSSGPVFNTMTLKNQQAILDFKHIGSGLMTTDKYGYVKGFEIAGSNKKFHYAKAYIDNDKLIVYSPEVDSPVAVRYNWADDASDGNLFNVEGFPAVPFKTDQWKGTTEDQKFQIEK